MRKCCPVIFCFFYLVFMVIFGGNLFGEDLNFKNPQATMINENISVGVYEESDYRRDSFWEETSPKPFVPGLEILSNIEKAEITFYDEYVGITPYETNSLSSGQYRVKIVKTGYRTEEFSFFLDMSKRTVLKIELLPYVGKFFLSGITPDTQIKANNLVIDNPMGKDVVAGDVEIELPVGENKIRLLRFGFTTEDFTVTVSTKKRAQYSIVWREADPEILDFDIIPRFGNLFTKSPQKIDFLVKLNSAGTLTVTLLNEKGEKMGISLLENDTALVKGVIETENALLKGDYTVVAQFLSRGKSITVKESFPVSSKNLNRYQTSRSGLSGLLFVPSAKTLYPLSYAFSVETDGAYDYLNKDVSVPLFLSSRFSPYLNFEGSLGVVFSFEPNTGDSFLILSTGCKYNLPILSDLFSLATALRFTYSGILPEFTGVLTSDPFSNTTGVAVLFPLEFQWTSFRILFTPELNIVPFELSDKNLAEESFVPFSGADIYSTIRLGGEFQSNGFVVGISGAFKTPGFFTGEINWLGGYIGCELGYQIPATILQINGLFFLEIKKEGLKTIGGGISLGLLL